MPPAIARAGYEEVVKLPLDKVAIVDARGRDGGTALHAAVAEGHKHIAELLLSHGANYRWKSTDGIILHVILVTMDFLLTYLYYGCGTRSEL